MPETTTRAEVLDGLRDILISDLRVPLMAEQLDEDVALFGTGFGMDSIDAVDLVMAIERRFGVSLGDGPRARESMRSLASLTAAVLDANSGPGEGAEVIESDSVVIVSDVPAGGAAHESSLDAVPGPVPEGYEALRSSVALCVDRKLSCVRVSGDDAFELLDRICSRDIFLRPERMLHCLFMAEDGSAGVDVLLSSEDRDYVLLAQGAGESELVARLEAMRGDGESVEIEGLSSTHAVFGLHGPFAWQLLERVVGPNVLGIPYLSSFDLFEYGGRCYRAGPTGEFGYEFLIPHERVESLLDELRQEGRDLGLGTCSEDAIRIAGMEAGFYQASVEPLRATCAVELQLSWRLTPDREVPGMKIAGPRVSSLASRARWFVSRLDAATLPPQTPVGSECGEIGKVLYAAYAPGLGLTMGLFSTELALDELAQLDLRVAGETVELRHTPLMRSLSLRVDPQRHTYATHVEDGLTFELPRAAD